MSLNPLEGFLLLFCVKHVDSLESEYIGNLVIKSLTAPKT